MNRRSALDTAEAGRLVHRICSAWDYGVHPGSRKRSRLERWKDIFDRYPVLTSPAYHAFRGWFRWEPMTYPANE